VNECMDQRERRRAKKDQKMPSVCSFLPLGLIHAHEAPHFFGRKEDI